MGMVAPLYVGVDTATNQFGWVTVANSTQHPEYGYMGNGWWVPGWGQWNVRALPAAVETTPMEFSRMMLARAVTFELTPEPRVLTDLVRKRSVPVRAAARQPRSAAMMHRRAMRRRSM